MFLRKNASSEIEAAFEKELVKNAVEEQTAGLTKVAEAMNILNRAAEIFDEVGLHKEAEAMTYVLESLAATKGKKKKAKKPGKADKSLTSEKMVDNLKHKGWVFDADDNFVAPREIVKDRAFWLSRARTWYEKALEFEKNGKRFQAAECFNKADACEAKAEEAKREANLIDDDFPVSDDEYFDKDEREADLARMMHEREQEHLEPDFEDEDVWDFPFSERTPKRF